MFKFGGSSRAKLDTCHYVLQEIMEAAIEVSPMDFTVLFGYRGEELQNSLFDEGRSQLRFPDSKHNATDPSGEPESMAVDIAPWFEGAPHVRWSWPQEFRWLAGFVMGVGEPIARRHGYTLRWGGDWDRDGNHHDSSFMDLPHLELVWVG